MGACFGKNEYVRVEIVETEDEEAKRVREEERLRMEGMMLAEEIRKAYEWREEQRRRREAWDEHWDRVANSRRTAAEGAEQPQPQPEP